MDFKFEYLNYISFVTFLDYDARQIEDALLHFGQEVPVDVSDEEYVSSLCREKAEKGTKVFLFYGMDSRLVEYGRDICAVMVKKGTMDFISTEFDRGQYSSAVILLYNGEYADCGLLSEQWRIAVTSFNMSCSESARNSFLDKAERNAVYIGPQEFAYMFRSRGLCYRTVALSHETLLGAIRNAYELWKSRSNIRSKK